jgi:hypothetical protein
MGYIFWTHYDPTQADFQIVETFPWIPSLWAELDGFSGWTVGPTWCCWRAW